MIEIEEVKGEENTIGITVSVNDIVRAFNSREDLEKFKDDLLRKAVEQTKHKTYYLPLNLVKKREDNLYFLIRKGR